MLPQYHPKQLLELMNSGKINRVKISNHLEIESIPPLPLYALFAADSENIV